MNRFLLALMTLGFVQHAAANDVRSVLDIRSAGVGGTGCIGGNADIRLIGQTLQIRTPGLVAVTTEAEGLARKNCAISIPFKLKQNERLIVSNTRLNAALNLKRKAVVKTSGEVFIAGSSGARAESTDSGPKNQLSIFRIGGVSTACGEDGILRLNMSQILQAKNVRSQARINGATLRVQVVKCN